MTAPTMANGRSDLDWLVDHLTERTGLDFTGCHRDRMVATVSRMSEEAGASSFEVYRRRLVGDEQEYERLLDRLTVGETYFLREPGHFELLRQTIAPDWSRRLGEQLRVWSAGCASGEEAYSAAITLADLGLRGRYEIVGTDISERAIDRARAGVYGPWSLRRCDEAQRRAWFRCEGRRFHLDERYREGVRWAAQGLLDGPPAGAFDVVLCRNVLIYLTPEAVSSAGECLHDALAPEGWLLLGASDPLLDHPGLQRVLLSDGVAYRRLARRAQPQRGDTVPAPSTSAPRARPAGAPRPARRPRPEAATQPETVGPAGIRALGGQGRLAEAGHAVEAAITADPADAEIRYLAASVHLLAGRSVDAARAAAAAVYLDPGLVVAHLMLAQTQQVAGHAQQADRSYRNALELLDAMPPDATVPLADGELAGELAAVVEARLQTSPGRARR